MAVWGTTLILHTLALLYMTFFVRDTRGKEARLLTPAKVMPEKDNSKLAQEIVTSYESPKNSCIIILKNLLQCFVVTFKPREGFKRACILILMAAMCLTLLSGCKKIALYL